MQSDVNDPEAGPPLTMPQGRPSFCGECGYDVQGLVTARCPECGEPLRRAGVFARRQKKSVFNRVLLFLAVYVPVALIVGSITLAYSPTVGVASAGGNYFRHVGGAAMVAAVDAETTATVWQGRAVSAAEPELTVRLAAVVPTEDDEDDSGGGFSFADQQSSRRLESKARAATPITGRLSDPAFADKLRAELAALQAQEGTAGAGDGPATEAADQLATQVLKGVADSVVREARSARGYGSSSMGGGFGEIGRGVWLGDVNQSSSSGRPHLLFSMGVPLVLIALGLLCVFMILAHIDPRPGSWKRRGRQPRDELRIAVADEGAPAAS